jgi:hypothetical protein
MALLSAKYAAAVCELKNPITNARATIMKPIQINMGNMGAILLIIFCMVISYKTNQ